MQLEEVATEVWHARAEHVGWMLVTDGHDVTVVDTGYPGDREALLRSLELIGRSPADVAAVLLTHAHPDHIGSAEHLRTHAPAPVLTHELEVPHARGELIEQVTLGAFVREWGVTALLRREVVGWLRDVLKLHVLQAERLGAVDGFADGQLNVPGGPVAIHAPGHTAGHCVFNLAGRGVLHVGDAMFMGHHLSRHTGPQPAMPFFDADHEQALQTIENLAGISADVVVSGHGPVFRGAPAEAVRLALAAA